MAVHAPSGSHVNVRSSRTAAASIPPGLRGQHDGQLQAAGHLNPQPEKSQDLPTSSQRLRRSNSETRPEQIHISFAGPGAVSISWVTHAQDVTAITTSPHPSQLRQHQPATLQGWWGAAQTWLFSASSPSSASPDSLQQLNRQAQADSTHNEWALRKGATSANGSYTCYTSAEYESGALHSVILGQGPEGPLLPSTTYYYQVGDPAPGGEMSPVFSFNTTPPVGPASLPYRLGLVGDLGQTLDSAKTLQHLVEVQPQSILNVGDLSYADGYQPRWDTYGRLVQPSTAHIAWMNIEGNHEQELVGADEKSWLAYALRFSATDVSSGSGTTMYYSYDIAAAHVIMIGSYADFDSDSAQYAWLQQDLQRVDRSRTPWLIVGMHVPWYNSYHSHHGEGDAIRESLEELLFQYGVDLIFTGHVHSYERSRRVLRGQPNPCGPIHVTIGDGGNREGAAIGWEEPQPEWSEVREPSFGMGVLEFVDSTTAIWQWYRNSETPVKDTADEVVFVRDPTCQPTQLKEAIN
ncbi:hypothetical protein WJX74_007259 [Apatococcus lobatus]|uniref:Purple acid phosphatase n=1 Tax=Apatococcus lobatus TaxID=904363 RepID=A0AAW1QI10_9CHLO